MSLDLDLEVIKPCSIHSQNFTHNVVPMWELAGVYDALYMSDGKLAKDILPALEKGIVDMKANPEKYKKLDSPNGWGIYDHALPWLIEFYDACGMNQDAIIRVSK